MFDLVNQNQLASGAFKRCEDDGRWDRHEIETVEEDKGHEKDIVPVGTSGNSEDLVVRPRIITC